LSKSIADNIGAYLYFIKQDVMHISNMLSKGDVTNKKRSRLAYERCPEKEGNNRNKSRHS
ncbi:hypothetical protein, partial [Dissulfurispira sp.]|uniref:hypothetical protein n=1 Tax=Dissulfurispira sp. TaxID=2817609 RepID=UPI002FDAFC0A